MARQARRFAASLAAAAAAIVALPLWAQLPMEPAHTAGQSITGAFEGWFRNPDGTAVILVGYFNRNTSEAIDIPIGENNRIEPGGPDRGQPTHFHPGRQWGVFTIHVGKEFPSEAKLTWTIRANGKTTVIPLKLDPLWIVSPYKDASNNTPPFISFEAGQLGSQGPTLGILKSYTATTDQPLEIDVWVADDAQTGLNPSPLMRSMPPVMLKWIALRGPADAKIAPARPRVEKGDSPPEGLKFAGKARTALSFPKPGEYLLELIANDWSGEGGSGFQCCWSTAQIRVTVR